MVDIKYGSQEIEHPQVAASLETMTKEDKDML